MTDRFTGPDNRDNRVRALQSQSIVQGGTGLAEYLADNGEITTFEPGETLVRQGESGDDLFFLLSGTVDIIVNDHTVAQRSNGQVVGEMTVVDPTTPRSATVTASTAVIALRATEAQLEEAAKLCPLLWRRLSVLVMNRLRERGKLHRPANDRPILFIGSSAEGLKVAREVEAALAHDNNIDVRLWSSGGVFRPSGITIQDLLRQVDEADFSLLVLHPDDMVTSRGVDQIAPRDNVVFEMGLFLVERVR